METYHPIRLTKSAGLRGRWAIAKVEDSTLGGVMLLSLVGHSNQNGSLNSALQIAEHMNRQLRAPTSLRSPDEPAEGSAVN